MSIKDKLYNAKKAFLSWGADIRIYQGGIILWGPSSYKIKGRHMRAILTLVEPGDILLRRYNNYLGSRLIPGFWSHGAVFAGEDTIIHMLGDGITSEDILTFMRTDHIMILRHPDLAVCNKAVEIAWDLSRLSIEYDYDFNEDDTKKLYCTEFVNVCFNNIVDPYVKGNDIMPDDFLKVPELKKIWSSVENQ